jgi:Fe-Mn family superoxide dismutase
VALDSWEHAFMIDYGIKRIDYVGAFMENVKWGEVSRRFALAKR